MRARTRSRRGLPRAKVGNASAFMHDVWSIPLQLAIGSYMLYGYLGVAGLVGVGVMCLVLPCNLLISRKLKGFNERLMKAPDLAAISSRPRRDLAAASP